MSQSQVEFQVIVPNEQQNSRVPQAVFFPNAREVIDQYGYQFISQKIQQAIKQFQMTLQQFSRFQYQMELKVPEIEQTLKIIRKIEHEQETNFDVKFQLIPGIYQEVECQKDNKVILYLGADTYVEYSYQEAIDLLQQNLENAQNNIKTYQNDIEYLRDQINILQVNYS